MLSSRPTTDKTSLKRDGRKIYRSFSPARRQDRLPAKPASRGLEKKSGSDYYAGTDLNSIKERNVIEQGIFLMFIGMGIVFLFLVILVITVQIISAFLGRFFPEAEEAAAPAHAITVSRDGEIAAAIAAVAAFTKH